MRLENAFPRLGGVAVPEGIRMIRRLSQLVSRLFPLDDSSPMEIGLFRKTCLATAFLSLFIVIPANYLQGLPLRLNLALLIFSVLAYVLYRASMRGVHAMNTFVGLVVLLLDFSWFMNAGSYGSIGMFMFSGVLVLNIFFQNLIRWLYLVAFILNGLALLWLERVFPALVVPYPSPLDRQWDLMTSFVVSTFACILVVRIVLAAYNREREGLKHTNAQLEQALAEIRTLQGLLPICSWCKKIRDDEGLWTQVEDYVAKHTEASFTHGMCPECAKTHFPGKQDQVLRSPGSP